MTTGKHVHLSVHEIVHVDYKRNPGRYSGYTRVFNVQKLAAGNTYYAIFSEGQEEDMANLVNSDYYHIVYEAPKAVNKNPNHGYEPRNTLVIFEVKDGQGS